MLLRAIRYGGRKFCVGFVVGEMEMGICFWNIPLFPFCMSGKLQSFFRSCPSSVVFSGMAVCLVLVYMGGGTPGPPPSVSWLAVLGSAVLVLILLTIPVSEPRLISVMRMILLWK